MELNEKDSQYWDKRKKVGKPKLFDSPSELWGHACDYFKKCDSTPWVRRDFKGKDAHAVDIPTTAPYLWTGFEDYLFERGLAKTLKDYRTASRNEDYRDGAYREYAEIVRAIDRVITTQKVSGALVGAYSPNLVARLEGLADKTEETVTIKETKIGFD